MVEEMGGGSFGERCDSCGEDGFITLQNIEIIERKLFFFRNTYTKKVCTACHRDHKINKILGNGR